MKNILKTAIITVLITVAFMSVTAFADVNGIITADVLNIRSFPSTDAAILGQLKNGDPVSIVETANNWHKISYGAGYAFISADYVSTNTSAAPTSAVSASSGKNVTGVVIADVLNVRSYPSTDSGVLGLLNNGDSVIVTEAKDNWYKITYGTGYAFVSADYVAVSYPPVVVNQFSSISTPSSPASLSKGQTLVEYAKKFIGTPYVYGGMSPSGFDCSGFVKYCYSYMGVNINRIACDQALNGYEVSRENMQPGDILCFVSSVGGSYIGHTGIYVGNGQFIHSPREGYTVEIIPLTSGTYSQRLTNIRRIFN